MWPSVLAKKGKKREEGKKGGRKRRGREGREEKTLNIMKFCELTPN